MTEKYNFLFPHFVARRMKAVKQTTPLIVSAVAVCFLLIGLTALVIYRTVTLENGFLFEGFVILNLCAGYVLLSAAIITNLNQHKRLKEFERRWE